MAAEIATMAHADEANVERIANIFLSANTLASVSIELVVSEYLTLDRL